ncbi:unnamed protein product [Gemmataceae bacterium]|nr:unnamed protein product [Gemmataceae bacterium]VTU01752.1 unnamed protein product [Gemmataceae bacterium]
MTANAPPALPPGFPPELGTLATEIHTYFGELPRLLDEWGEAKFVVVKGQELFGVWDTHLDAIQHGRILFGEERFLAQELDYRLLNAFGPFFGVGDVSSTHA